jgi:adenylate cyclase
MQQLARYALGLIALAVLISHAAHFYHLNLITRLDAIVYDSKLRLTMPQGIDERIVIINIDEKSLAEIGRWPWGRDRLAELVTKAFENYGIVLLGIDVILAERDESSGLKVLETLARGPLRSNAQFESALIDLRPELDYDRRFADTLRKYPVIVGFNFANGGKDNAIGALPAPALPADAFKGRDMHLASWNSYSGNRQEFLEASLGAGHNNGLPDLDGVSRRIPLLVEYDGNYYEALSLAMARAAIGNPKPALSFQDRPWLTRTGYDAIECIELKTGRGTVRIPVDAHAGALIPYRGEQGSFRYYSAGDLLATRIPQDALRGKIALLGATAQGLLDLRSTPVGEAYPGVEIHANLVSGILDGRIKATHPYLIGAEITLLLVVGLIMVFWLPRYSPLTATLGFLALLAIVIEMNVALWQYGNVVMPLASVLLLILIVYALNMAFGYFVESHAKRRLTRLFGQYVPPELVTEMSRNPDHYDMEGRSAELTVLFADIRGFTAFSEELAPQALARMMNEYFSAMTAVIRESRGTLDKYVGDAIMAFWGAPVEDSLHARHAVIAGLHMQARLPQLNAVLEPRGLPRLAIGIGINSGPMTVGDMGSLERKAYTVLGDAVNLGNRLEALTAYYEVGILIGEATQRLLPDIVCREIDRVRVKGRAASVAVYEPVGRESDVDDATKAEIALWQAALGLYRDRQWDAAEARIMELAASAPERRLYALYLQRIVKLREQSPASPWDGVWQFARQDWPMGELGGGKSRPQNLV